MARLIDLGGAPANRSEAEIIQRLSALLPSPWVVIPNASVSDRSGHAYEYDAIVVGPHAVYVVEVKGWRGTIRQLSHAEWQLAHGRIERSPLPLADQKARVLKSILKASDLGGRRAPYVQACLVCGSDDSVFEVAGPDLRRCLLPGQLVPYLLDASQLGAGGMTEDYRPVIHRLVLAITGSVEARAAGPRRYGSYLAESLQTRDDESATWLGRHAVFPDGRVYRIRTWYLSAYRYSAEQREQRQKVLRRSAEALHRIGEHPNIATLRDFGEQAGEFYEVTDWSESGTLETAFAKGTLQRLPLPRRLSLLRDMAEGLEVAFRHGVLHRDLAPSAVILTPDGRARLINFDRAFLEASPVTVYGGFPRRSSAYLPPELRDPKSYEVFDNSDLYSLARIALQVLGADLPDAVQDLLRRAARDDRDARPADPAAFLAELSSLLAPRDLTPAPTAGAPAGTLPSFDFRPGDVIDGVNRVIDEIGRGSGAVVYRVENDALGEIYALKLVIAPPAGYDPAAEFRWLRSTASLHLPHAHWLGRLPLADGSLGPSYLLLDCIQGQSLRQQIERGPVPVDQALSWIDDLLDALEALHPSEGGPGALHRDVKPENVLVGPGGAVLIDFGTASDACEAGAVPLGTLRYTPPDLAGSGWIPSADLFAVGCILYELVAGTHPWEAAPPSADRPPRPLREVRSDLREPLARFIEKAIASNASARFSTAMEMRSALSAVREALARPRTTAMAPPGEALDQGARDLWNGRRIQALASCADILAPLARALGDCVLPAADETPDAAEAALIGSEARALVLESPMPDALPSLYDLLARGALPASHEAAEDAPPAMHPCDVGAGDLLLILDGLHFTEWPLFREAASVVSRRVEGWAWAAGPVDPAPAAAENPELDGALARVMRGAPTPAVIEPLTTAAQVIKSLAAAGARAFRVRLPGGDRMRVRLGPLLVERRRILEDVVLTLLPLGARLWVGATFGSIYLGHGLRQDVGEGLGDGADEARARWAAAFPRGRVGTVQPGRLSSSLRLPVREADGRRFPVGRLAWPDAPSTPWLQSGGLSLPERLLPLFRIGA